LALVAGIQKGAHGRFNLDDRRYEVPSRVLEYLARDLVRDRPVKITIDFNPYHQSRYCTSSQGGGFFSSGSQSSYHLAWLSLEGCFLDGNSFRLTTALIVKRKEPSKRKYTKVKETLQKTISLILDLLKTRRYQLENVSTRLQAAKLPRGLQLKQVGADGRRLRLIGVTDPQLRVKDRSGTTGKDAENSLTDEHKILALFVACYYALARSRQERKGA